MLHVFRQLRPRPLRRLSVFGDGLPERLRSTSIALLGIAAATGLAMVALALKQEFPLIEDAPIPDLSAPSEAGHDRTAPHSLAGQRSTAPAVDASGGSQAPSQAEGQVTPIASTPPVGGATPETGPGPAGGKRVDPREPPDRASPSPAPKARAPRPLPVVEAPTAAPSAQPSELPPATEPEPVVEPEPEQAPSSGPGNGNAFGKGNGKGLGNGGIPPGQEARVQVAGAPEE